MDTSTSYTYTGVADDDIADDVTNVTATHIDPYGGSTWPISTWADADADYDPSRLDTLEALEAAQTWEEVLTCPVITRDDTSFFHPVASDRWPVRTQVPVAQRPERGRITVRQGSEHAARNVPTSITATLPVVATLAYDGSPVTERGTSSKKSRAASKAAATKAAKSAAKMAALGFAPKVAGPAPIMENGEVIGWQ